jgi:hypothetical protein
MTSKARHLKRETEASPTLGRPLVTPRISGMWARQQIDLQTRWSLPLAPEASRMRDVSELRFLCSAFCKPYQSEAKFYVEETNPSGSGRREPHLLADEGSPGTIPRMGGADACAR